MVKVSVVAFSFLLSTALSAPVKVKDETRTLFHGEDFHILLSSLGMEITFRPISTTRATDVTLMRGEDELHTRAKLNRQLSYLNIENVGEADEGVYTVKNPEKPEDTKRITLIVRDCTMEKSVMYGHNYDMQLLGVTLPITLEYRPKAVEANHTARPGLVLLTNTGLSRDGYQGRINVSDRHVTLSAVTGADEGSYTISDAQGTIKKKVCLIVKAHRYFVKLPHGETLKINQILNSSLVDLYYTSNDDSKRHLLINRGEITTAQAELGMEGRLSLEGSVVVLEKVKDTDVGQYIVSDILGFHVSTTDVKLEPYRLPSVYVAVIALCGLLVLLLLVCLLSCLVKVKKRAKRNAALEKIAQDAGKEDEGDAFRQVVKNITQLNDESKHSQADNTEKSQSTEVDIKGLEVSSKEVGVGNLETSDSGVGFNTTALPLDTDTDVPDQIPESEDVSVSVAPETKSSPPPAAETKPSAPPATEIRPSPLTENIFSPVPETKKTPDQPTEPKLDVPKSADVKLSPIPSPEPKAKTSPSYPLDAKTPEPKPAPSPSPEPKPASPLAPPESKTALTLTPDPAKPTTIEPAPITNGTPEPESKLSPAPADLIGAAPKAGPPKTTEIELNSSSSALEAKVDVPASKDGALAEDSTTTTT